MKPPYWGPVLVVTYVLLAVDHNGDWQHLAAWKKTYLAAACVAIIAACVLDALARRRRKR